MGQPSDIVGVVWDLGNVLIPWTPLPAVAAGVGEVEAQRFLDEFDFAAWNHACDAGLAWEDALLALERDHPQWLSHGQSYVDHFPRSLGRPIAGCVDLVEELHAAGVPQWGLTNWSASLFERHAASRFDFLARFEDVVVSGAEGVAKPDPRIFGITAARTGYPLGRLAFLDDSPANVAAAAAAGMHARQFADPQRARTDLRSLGLPV